MSSRPPVGADRLPDHLQLSVGEGSDVVAEGICRRPLGPLLVGGDEAAHTRKVHRRCREPVFVVDYTVDRRAELRLDGTALRPDHRPSDQLRVEVGLGDRADKAHRVVEVPAEEQDVRRRTVTTPRLFEDCGEVVGGKAVFGLRDHVESVLLRIRPSAGDGVLGEVASAAMIATVRGIGSCRDAVSKKPAVRAAFGSGPVGIMAKNRSYARELLTPRPIRPTKNLWFSIATGMAGLIELLPYPPSSRSTLCSVRSFR